MEVVSGKARGNIGKSVYSETYQERRRGLMQYILAGLSQDNSTYKNESELHLSLNFQSNMVHIIQITKFADDKSPNLEKIITDNDIKLLLIDLIDNSTNAVEKALFEACLNEDLVALFSPGVEQYNQGGHEKQIILLHSYETIPLDVWHTISGNLPMRDNINLGLASKEFLAFHESDQSWQNKLVDSQSVQTTTSLSWWELKQNCDNWIGNVIGLFRTTLPYDYATPLGKIKYFEDVTARSLRYLPGDEKGRKYLEDEYLLDQSAIEKAESGQLSFGQIKTKTEEINKHCSSNATDLEKEALANPYLRSRVIENNFDLNKLHAITEHGVRALRRPKIQSLLCVNWNYIDQIIQLSRGGFVSCSYLDNRWLLDTVTTGLLPLHDFINACTTSCKTLVNPKIQRFLDKRPDWIQGIVQSANFALALSLVDTARFKHDSSAGVQLEEWFNGDWEQFAQLISLPADKHSLLKNKWIFDQVMNRYLSIKDLKETSKNSCDALLNPKVQSFLAQYPELIQRVAQNFDVAWVLGSQWIRTQIRMGNLKAEQLNALTYDGAEVLCWPAMQELLKNNWHLVDQVIALSPKCHRLLTNSWVFRQVQQGYLTINDLENVGKYAFHSLLDPESQKVLNQRPRLIRLAARHPDFAWAIGNDWVRDCIANENLQYDQLKTLTSCGATALCSPAMQHFLYENWDYIDTVIRLTPRDWKTIESGKVTLVNRQGYVIETYSLTTRNRRGYPLLLEAEMQRFLNMVSKRAAQ